MDPVDLNPDVSGGVTQHSLFLVSSNTEKEHLTDNVVADLNPLAGCVKSQIDFKKLQLMFINSLLLPTFFYIKHAFF